MIKFVHRPNPVFAFRYAGETCDELPDFLKEYRNSVPDVYGNRNVSVSAVMELVIPRIDGGHVVKQGEWVVLNRGMLHRYSDSVFHETFEEKEEIVNGVSGGTDDSA